MVIQPGFIQKEAEDFIGICVSVGDHITKMEHAGFLRGETLDFSCSQSGDWCYRYGPSSSVPPYDGYFEIWEDTSCSDADTARIAICFRGTVLTIRSVLADIKALMLHASKIKGYSFVGNMGRDPVSVSSSAIHSGFAATAISYAENSELIAKVNELVAGRKAEIYIIGHSQGAAVAVLFRAMAAFTPAFGMPADAEYKVYSFAQPKPGNSYFSGVFNTLATNSGMAVTVNNSLDIVPQLPFTYQWFFDLNNPCGYASDDDIVRYIEDYFADEVKKLTWYAEMREEEIETLTNEAETCLRKIGVGEDEMKELLSFKLTFNYTLAGAEFTLKGTPQPEDFFSQHHATHYQEMIKSLA